MASTTSAAQLATALQVPKSTVIRQAKAAGWAFTEEPGRGGMRRVYAVEQLPANLRAALAWQGATPDATPASRAAAQAGKTEAARLALRGGLEAAATQARSQTALRQAGEMAAHEQARMDARLAVVRSFETFNADLGLPLKAARILFEARYNAGDVAVPPAVRALLPSTSAASIERWQHDIRTRGITALAGAYGNRAGNSKVSRQPEVREFVQAMLVTHPHARATQVMRGLRARFGVNGVTPADLPSMRSLERWMAEWRTDNAEVLQALTNPDAWKNKHMAAFGSKSETVTAINQLWERDSSPADVMCSDGRYTLIGGIDVFSRTAKLLVSRTSMAVAVGAHLRAMLLEFGVPAVDKTDNGSDYTALYTERVYTGLDIEHEKCPPFQPWHKPHIERFFGTFARDLVELLPGYIGHSVAERNAIEARKSFADRLMKRGEVVEIRMTGAELQAFCDQWVSTIYDQQPHEGLGQRTPFEVRSAAAHQVRRISDERALDVLLAEAPGRDGRRTVQKKGIALDRQHGARSDEGWYIAPELESWVGRLVHVRFDPIHHDLGTVFVFDAEGGAFICRAQDPSRTGIDRREVAVKTKALQRTRVQDERRALKAAAKKVGVDQVVGEILRDRAQAAGKLATLPVRRLPDHTSAGMQAGGAAARAAMAPQRTTADIQDLAAVQATQARIAADQAVASAAPQAGERRGPGPAPTPVFDSPGERVRWLLVQRKSRSLTPNEALTLQDFRRTFSAAFHRYEEMAEAIAGAQSLPQSEIQGRAMPG